MQLIVDRPQRSGKQRAHTATHLLHYLLDQLLAGTKQAGSLVDTDYLRFDFAAKEPLTTSQLIDLERAINAWIAADSPVTIAELPLAEAKKLGAKAFFEDKYGDIVRVITIPTTEGETNSVEFCGGTHVASTAMIGAFKITAQEAVASGIRRIEAVTGPGVAERALDTENQMRALATKLDCQPKQLDEKLTKLLSAYETIAGEKNQLQDLLITNVLKTLAPSGQSTFTYIVDLSAYRLDEIPLRQIVNHARVQRPDANRILTTQTGQYALYAGATKNAKELQATLGLKGGGDDLLVQGKTDAPFVL